MPGNSLLEVGLAGGRLVNIDGKTLCGSKKGEELALHVVSAWVHEQAITLSQLGAYSCKKEINGKPVKEEHYYISSFETTAEQYSYLIRNHWSIENGLHWIAGCNLRGGSAKSPQG